MNKILAIFKAENLLNSLKNIFSRFGFSAILSIITTIIFVLYNQERILMSFWFWFQELEIFARIWFSLILTFFLSVSFYIFSESKNFSNKKKQILQIFPILYGIFFYYFFDISQNNVTFDVTIFFIINVVWILSFLFFAPFVNKIFCKNIEKTPKNQENFYSYFTNILGIFITSFLVWFAVFALISVWFLTIDKLFDIYITSSKYLYVWLVSALFIAPFFALNNIPKKETFENAKFNENIFWLFLIKYIMIPAIFMYFIILYIYTAKVLINFESWPKWEVSWLVIGFSIFWYFIYLVSYMYEEKINFVKKFRKYFPAIVFPQIFMLFYAIFLRINQYWLTINRYFVVIFGIFLLLATIYYIFSKRKYLWVIFGLLFSFSIIISVWPWSVYNLPETLQTNLLKTELKKAGILSDSWEIKPLSNEEKFAKDTSEISEKIDYICEYHNCKKLAKDLTNGKVEIIEKINKDERNTYVKFEEMDNWSMRYNLKLFLNIDVNTYYNNKDNNKKNIFYYTDDKWLENFKFFVKWYDYFEYFNFYQKSTLKVNLEKEILEFYDDKNNTIIEKIDFKENLKELIKKWKENSVEKNRIIYDFETEKLKLKFVIENFNFIIENDKITKFNNDNNLYDSNSINWYILYTKK